MKLLDLNTVRSVMDADPEVVRQVLVARGWTIGPRDDPARFAAWLQARSYEPLDINESERVLALSLNYYTRRHPDASDLQIGSLACTVEEYTVGWHTYPTEEAYPWEGYAKQVLAAALGGALDETGSGVLPAWAAEGTPAPGHDPDALTQLLLRLLEALYFLPRPREE